MAFGAGVTAPLRTCESVGALFGKLAQADRNSVGKTAPSARNCFISNFLESDPIDCGVLR